MTEDEARAWLEARFSTRQIERLEKVAALVEEENARQNLVAASTIPTIWSRHIVDSAQLLLDDRDGRWLDVGTGGGFPGLIVACLRDEPTIMVEPRRKRVEFLTSVVEALGLRQAHVMQAMVEKCRDFDASIVSARAVASVGDLLAATRRVATLSTIFLFHRGRNWVDEMRVVEQSWDATFHVKQSVTNPESVIVRATEVRQK